MTNHLTGELLIRTSDGETHVCRNMGELNLKIKTLVSDEKKIIGLSMCGKDESIEQTATLFFGPNEARMRAESRKLGSDLHEDRLRTPEDDFTETMLLNERWSDIFERIRRAHEDTALWAAGITHAQVEDGTIVLFFRSTHHLTLVMSPPHADIICGAIRVSTGMNHPVTARFQGGA